MNAIYTVCTSSHLYRAKTLSDNVKAYHPEIPFFVCIIDDVSQSMRTRIEQAFYKEHLLYKADLPEKLYCSIDKKYSPLELSCAFKSVFAKHLLSRNDVQNLIYLDADTYLYARLDDSFESFSAYNIILTPQNLEPLDYRHVIHEQGILRTGTYNAGFLGLRKSEQTDTFLEWWLRRMEQLCRNYPSRGLFLDQVWLNLVPLYFTQVKILKHPGYNVAHFNMFNRTISKRGEYFVVNNDAPLVMFHFTGLDEEDENNISRYCTDESLEQWPMLMPLFSGYRKALIQNKILLKELQVDNEADKSRLRAIVKKFTGHRK